MKTDQERLDEALELLREIRDSGYIRTNITGDQTNLEERVESFLTTDH